LSEFNLLYSEITMTNSAKSALRTLLCILLLSASTALSQGPVPAAPESPPKLQPKSIAIINVADGGKSPIGNSELSFFADKLREIATEVLPQKDYVATTGKTANANYVCQISIGRFGNDYTIKVELNENETSIGFFTDNSKDMHGLLSIINEKAPIMFKKLLPEQTIATTPVATPASADTVAPTVSPVLQLAPTTATPAAKTAYTGSNKCYKEIFDLPKNNMQNFIKDLGISIATVQASCKTKWTCPADDKITDVGLTAGCLKQLPMDPNGILTMLKEIGLDVGTNAAQTGSIPADANEKKMYFELGYQRIGDMNHIRASIGWFYFTGGFGDDRGEFIGGGIIRWMDTEGITSGIGLFGGLGGGHPYGKGDSNIKHEFGMEFILGYFSFYFAERNFSRAGGGIGLIF